MFLFAQVFGGFFHCRSTTRPSTPHTLIHAQCSRISGCTEYKDLKSENFALQMLILEAVGFEIRRSGGFAVSVRPRVRRISESAAYCTISFRIANPDTLYAADYKSTEHTAQRAVMPQSAACSTRSVRPSVRRFFSLSFNNTSESAAYSYTRSFRIANPDTHYAMDCKSTEHPARQGFPSQFLTTGRTDRPRLRSPILLQYTV